MVFLSLDFVPDFLLISTNYLKLLKIDVALETKGLQLDL